MCEHQIIMTGESVRAILAGRKTQTRRVIDFDRCRRVDKAGHEVWGADGYDVVRTDADRSYYTARVPWTTESIAKLIVCPWQVGDHLWVREAWQDFCPIWDGYWCGCGSKEMQQERHIIVYAADVTPPKYITQTGQEIELRPKRWRSPILMPRWASRLTLEVTELRVQRLQEISEADAMVEGILMAGRSDAFDPALGPFDEFDTSVDVFARSWDQLNAKRGYPWESNPWVWAITFKVGALDDHK